MAHPDSTHDLLAPTDLPTHLTDQHGRSVASILAIGLDPSDITVAMDTRGIPTTDDATLDALIIFHETAHEVGDNEMQEACHA